MIGDAYAHVGDCPGCPHQTCVHTVSTEGGQIVYWNMDCWTCGYTLEDKQFLTSVMLYMMCSDLSGTPRDVMLDAIDSWVQYFLEFDDPWAQLEKEMKRYD